jgi:hypothetical protein
METASAMIFMLTDTGFLVSVMLVYNSYQFLFFEKIRMDKDVDAS